MGRNKSILFFLTLFNFLALSLIANETTPPEEKTPITKNEIIEPYQPYFKYSFGPPNKIDPYVLIGIMENMHKSDLSIKISPIETIVSLNPMLWIFSPIRKIRPPTIEFRYKIGF
jgi:hypothetical protein